MKTLINNLYHGAEGLKKTSCLLIFILYIGLTIYGGGSLAEFLLFGLIMVVYIWLPGKFWSFITKAHQRFSDMDFGIDILFGTGSFCALYCVAMRLHMRLLLMVLPLMISWK